MAAAAATHASPIVPVARSRRTARVSACLHNPRFALDHRLRDVVASLVFAAIWRGSLRLQYGLGRGAAARRAAPRPAGAALLQLDRASGVLWLLPETCRD